MEITKKLLVTIDAEEFNRLLTDIFCLIDLETVSEEFKTAVVQRVTGYMAQLGAAGLYEQQ